MTIKEAKSIIKAIKETIGKDKVIEEGIYYRQSEKPSFMCLSLKECEKGQKIDGVRVKYNFGVEYVEIRYEEREKKEMDRYKRDNAWIL